MLGYVFKHLQCRPYDVSPVIGTDQGPQVEGTHDLIRVAGDGRHDDADLGICDVARGTVRGELRPVARARGGCALQCEEKNEGEKDR